MIEKATSCRGLVVQNDKVLLIRRHKDNVDYWVFPGGHTENEEAPSEVASREILEETGLNVTEVGEVIFYDHPKWFHPENPSWEVQKPNATLLRICMNQAG